MRVREHFSAYAQKASIHGPADLLHARGPGSKGAWTLAILVISATFLYQACLLIDLYRQEVTGNEVRRHIPERIPDITLCPICYLRLSKMKANFPGISDMEAFMLYMLVDSFLPVGSAVKSLAGKIGYTNLKKMAESGSQAEQIAKFWPMLQMVAKASGLWEKSNGSVAKFIEDNGIGIDEMIESVSTSPIKTNDIQIKRHVSWSGICFAIKVPDSFPGLVYQLQLNVVLKVVDSEWVNLKKQLLGQFLDVSLFKEVRENDKDVDLMTIGGAPYKSFSGFRQGHFLPHDEYQVDVIPHHLLRLNLRRRPCRHYEFGINEYVYCVFNSQRERCTQCKMTFPDEPMSPSMTEECSYGKSEEFCMVTMFNGLNRSKTAELARLCPEPCIEQQYTVRNRPLGKKTPNKTVLHFTLRQVSQSTISTEYLRVGPMQMLSSLGGSMGLFFGVSVMAIFQAVQHLCMCRTTGTEAAVSLVAQ